MESVNILATLISSKVPEWIIGTNLFTHNEPKGIRPVVTCFSTTVTSELDLCKTEIGDDTIQVRIVADNITEASAAASEIDALLIGTVNEPPIIALTKANGPMYLGRTEQDFAIYIINYSLKYNRT